jgi:hypothetical protein
VRVVAGHEAVHEARGRPMVSIDGDIVIPAAGVVDSVKQLMPGDSNRCAVTQGN